MTKRISLRKAISGKKLTVKGYILGSKRETREARIERRLKAFRSLVGLWEDKDTSFFDNR